MSSQCDDGLCTGAEKTCNATQCTTAACDTATGDCLLTPVENGTSCDTGDRRFANASVSASAAFSQALLVADNRQCIGGECVNGPEVSCDDGNPWCDPPRLLRHAFSDDRFAPAPTISASLSTAATL